MEGSLHESRAGPDERRAIKKRPKGKSKTENQQDSENKAGIALIYLFAFFPLPFPCGTIRARSCITLAA